MAKHWTGPWRIEADPIFDGPDFVRIVGRKPTGQGAYVAKTVAHENAKLLVFAPEMFEELEAIAGNHDAGPGVDAAELCELMTQRARAVLAKIRGTVEAAG